MVMDVYDHILMIINTHNTTCRLYSVIGERKMLATILVLREAICC